MKNFYITTTLPYVNSSPHIGFASEIVQADVLARFHRLYGDEVVFNTGTDEHGQKIFQVAQETGEDPQVYCDRFAGQFFALKEMLNLSYTHFIRTTDAHHMKAAQEMWRRCDARGDIYKKNYRVKYCVGCELEKTDSELVNGRCPLHPNRDLELIEEENYFFRFSKYQKPLLDLYEKYPDFVVPEKRFNEIKRFVEGGLEDFSVSRLKSKMPWGVPVPGDEKHVMYVWFDALTNYISTLGWPEDEKNFVDFWGSVPEPNAIQIAGKDNLRQQSAMWQAMLLSADLPSSRQIFINGFITVDGQKMSKSLGNVIVPQEMVEKFGVDGARYLLLTMGAFGEDNDLTWERMTERYNADLANGLGNLLSRVVTLAGDLPFDFGKITFPVDDSWDRMISHMDYGPLLGIVWMTVREANRFVDEQKPWELKKTDAEKFESVMRKLLGDLFEVAHLLESFLPQTSEKMKRALETREKIALFERV
ncbi:MAG: methionine--tRNA ligase [Candidatus Moranbacteria bacterium]|nr:methionine--tRNA ligase [Candidatus Moranbacteria bacterium]